MATLGFTTAVLVFFLLAPALGYPLEYSQSLRILEIILPVFLGYLGSGALYVFRQDSPDDVIAFRSDSADLVGLLIKGPIIVFCLGLIALITAFGLFNSRAQGGGMSIDQLSGGMSAILGLLTVTTNVAIAYLFRGSHATKASATDHKNQSPEQH